MLLHVLSWATAHGWAVAGLIRSPITGPKGNVEFLALLQRGVDTGNPHAANLIDAVLASEPPTPTP